MVRTPSPPEWQADCLFKTGELAEILLDLVRMVGLEEEEERGRSAAAAAAAGIQEDRAAGLEGAPVSFGLAAGAHFIREVRMSVD